MLWLSARLFTRAVRFVDVLGAVGLSRVAMIALAPLLRARTGPDGTGAPGAIVVVVLPALTPAAWQLTWLFRGFRSATGLGGGKLVGAFVLGVVAAEALGVAITRS